jgi:hypothetical protein
MTTPLPIIPGRLPSAPQRYDQENEAVTRRILELMLRQTPQGGAGLLPRYDVLYTTEELPPCGEEEGFLDTTHPTIVLIIVQSSGPARIRFYANAAASAADENRPTWQAPDAGLGVLLDLAIVDEDPSIFYMSPATTLYNGDTPVANGVWFRFKNLSEMDAEIALTFTVVAIEAEA